MYAEKLEQVIKQCNEYSETHFGVKHGADYIQTMLDIMGSDSVRVLAALDMIGAVMMVEVSVAMDSIKPDDMHTMDKLLSLPKVGETIVKWFYYGMQVGKSIAETEMLEKLHKE